MILRHLKEKIYILKKLHVKLDVLYDQLSHIRKTNNILVICSMPTYSNWLGIKNATISLFPENTFIIPQYYSQQVYTNYELQLIANKITELKFNVVIFSGFPEYFKMLAEYVHSTCKAVVFHGALSELTPEKNQLELIFSIAKKKHIQKIGFIKKGLKECFDSSVDFEAFHLLLKTNPISNVNQMLTSRNKNIGVFGNTSFNKNLDNQVAGALLVDNYFVNVLTNNKFSYLDKSQRIINHKPLEREAFLSLLGSMSINLHISFSESWGQIVTESLSLGVPCLTSNNNGIFDYDEFLAEKLIVNQYDNPIAIAAKIKDVLENREEISERGIEYIQNLNKIADEKLQNFLE